MTTITVDKKNNPELAALVADKKPGDWVKLEASLKSNDDQTIVLRLENCDDCEKPAAEEDGETEVDAESAAEDGKTESVASSLAKKLEKPASMEM